MNKVTVPFFISHQGCPHTCVFCDQRAISGNSGLLPNRDEITAKILKWKDSAGNRPLEIAFFGGTFTALDQEIQNSLLAPVQTFLSTGTVTGIRISTRPDCLNIPIVQRLAEQGVHTIEVGVQSTDNCVLAASGRGHAARTSIDALACIKSCGLSAGAQLMPGLPDDSLASSLQSLKDVVAAGADFVRFYPVVVLRGTELARRYQEGSYQPLSLDAGVAICKVLLQTSLRLGVDVVRIGLQADQGLNPDTVLAGCWHPALGQLVRSELFFDLLVQLIYPHSEFSQHLTLSCHPSRVSDIVGHERKNMVRLRDRGFSIDRIVADAGLTPFECAVVQGAERRKGNIITELEMYYA